MARSNQGLTIEVVLPSDSPAVRAVRLRGAAGLQGGPIYPREGVFSATIDKRKRDALRAVDLDQFGRLRRWARESAETIDEKSLVDEIGSDPIRAIALEIESPEELGIEDRWPTLIEVDIELEGRGGFARALAAVLPGMRLRVVPRRTEIFRTSTGGSASLSAAWAPRITEYGWGLVRPTDPCQKVMALPRQCLPQRTVVEIDLPNLSVEAAFKSHLALRRERQELFGVGLPPAQVADAEHYYAASTGWLPKLERWLVRHAFAAHQKVQAQPPATAEAIQAAAHAFFGRAGPWSPRGADDDALLRALVDGLRPGWPELDGPDGLVFEFPFAGPAGPFDRQVVSASAGSYLPEVAVSVDREVSRVRSIRYRLEPSDPWTVVDGSTPGTSPAWVHARRLARLASFVAGQYEAHVATHLLLESLQVALRRCLERGTVSARVAVFLAPFVDGVAEINNYGNGLIVDTNGILCRGTGLSPVGSAAYAAWALGRCDWKGYAPRAPLGRNDPYAHRAQAAWAFVGAYVDHALPREAGDVESFQSLFDELFDHSVPCTAPSRVSYLAAVHGEIPEPPSSPSRAHPDGVPRALSRVDARTRAEVVAFLQYFLFQATFVHGHANDQQLDEGGDLTICPLAVREKGVPLDLADYWARFAPRVPEAAMQLFMVESLSRVWSPPLSKGALWTRAFGDGLAAFAERGRRGLAAARLDPSRIRRAPSV